MASEQVLPPYYCRPKSTIPITKQSVLRNILDMRGQDGGGSVRKTPKVVCRPSGAVLTSRLMLLRKYFNFCTGCSLATVFLSPRNNIGLDDQNRPAMTMICRWSGEQQPWQRNATPKRVRDFVLVHNRGQSASTLLVLLITRT